MVVARYLQAEQRLQQAVDMGRGEEILAARHQGDALQRVVDGDGEMVARRHLLAREHDVAVARRIGPHGLRLLVDPVELADAGERASDIEAEGEGLAGGDARPSLGRVETAAGAGIERPFRPVRRAAGARYLGLDRRARAEAGIDEAHRRETVERPPVIGKMRRLPPHRPVPVEAEPGEIGERRLGELGAAACRIDVLETEEKASTGLACAPPGEQGGKSVAEMEVAGRTRSEAGDGGWGSRAGHDTGASIANARKR